MISSLKRLLNRSAKKPDTGQEAPAVAAPKASGGYVTVVDGFIPLEGGYGVLQHHPPVPDEDNVLQQLRDRGDDADIIYYTFHDGKGNVTPKRFVNVDVVPNPDTGDLSVVCNVNGTGTAAYFKLMPGDKVLDLSGAEVFCMMDMPQQEAPEIG